jgi:acetylornithine/succinyldiaminopimelate/putrescine aminotransferase
MLDPIRTQSNIAPSAHIREVEGMRVSRATFDEVMFQTYVPAQFVPVRAAGSRIWDTEGKAWLCSHSGTAILR